MDPQKLKLANQIVTNLHCRNRSMLQTQELQKSLAIENIPRDVL